MQLGEQQEWHRPAKSPVPTNPKSSLFGDPTQLGVSREKLAG